MYLPTYTKNVYITQGHVCCYFKHQTERQHIAKKKAADNDPSTHAWGQNPTNNKQKRSWQFGGGATDPRIINSAKQQQHSQHHHKQTEMREYFDEYYEKYPSAGDTIDMEMTMRWVS